MQDKLRRRYQILKEVSRSSYFEGRLKVAELPRLCDLLTSSVGEISLKFEFQNSGYKGIAMISGQIQTGLQVECQRCLDAMATDLQFDFKLLVDADDDIVSESSLDTVYSDDGYIDIFEVVEDEVILALPLVAMHGEADCNQHWQKSDESQNSKVRNNPFSVLKDLKTTH